MQVSKQNYYSDSIKKQKKKDKVRYETILKVITILVRRKPLFEMDLKSGLWRALSYCRWWAIPVFTSL